MFFRALEVAGAKLSAGGFERRTFGVAQRCIDTRFSQGLEKIYPTLGKISVDYALMEKADNIVMACGMFMWDDIGTWPALENHYPQDPDGNTLIGRCEQVDAKNNIVFSKDRLTAVIGAENLIVVQAEGVTLVCPKEKAQEIKKMLARLREQGSYDCLL